MPRTILVDEAKFVFEFADKTFSHRMCNDKGFLERTLIALKLAYKDANASQRALFDKTKEGDLIDFKELRLENGNHQPRYVIFSIPSYDAEDVRGSKPKKWLEKLAHHAYLYDDEQTRKIPPKREPLDHVVFVKDHVDNCLYAVAPAFLTINKKGETCGSETFDPYQWVIVSAATAREAAQRYEMGDSTPVHSTVIGQMMSKNDQTDWSWTFSKPTSMLSLLMKNASPPPENDVVHDDSTQPSASAATDDDDEDVTYTPPNKSFATTGKIVHDKVKYVSPASPSSKTMKTAAPAKKRTSPVPSPSLTTKTVSSSSSSSAKRTAKPLTSSPPSQKKKTAATQRSTDTIELVSDHDDALLKELASFFTGVRVSADLHSRVHTHISDDIDAISLSHTKHIKDGRNTDMKTFKELPDHALSVVRRDCSVSASAELPPQMWGLLAYLSSDKNVELRGKLDDAPALFQTANLPAFRGALTAVRSTYICSDHAALNRAVTLATADAMKEYDRGLCTVLTPVIEEISAKFTALQNDLKRGSVREQELHRELSDGAQREKELQERIDELSKQATAKASELSDVKKKLTTAQNEAEERLAAVDELTEQLAKAKEPVRSDIDF